MCDAMHVHTLNSEQISCTFSHICTGLLAPLGGCDSGLPNRVPVCLCKLPTALPRHCLSKSWTSICHKQRSALSLQFRKCADVGVAMQYAVTQQPYTCKPTANMLVASNLCWGWHESLGKQVLEGIGGQERANRKATRLEMLSVGLGLNVLQMCLIVSSS